MPKVQKLLRKYIDLPSDDGKRHRVTVSAATPKELEQKYRDKLMELAKNDFRFAKTATVANFFGRYVRDYLRPTKSGSHRDTESRLRRYLVEPLGRRELSSVTALVLQELLNNQSDKSKSFIKKFKDEIASFFEAAEDEGLVQKNPCKRLYLPECEEKKRRALTEKERNVFLAAADQHRHGLLFIFIYYCGLRPGEVRVLMPDDIDYEAQTITVSRALDNRTGRIKDPKTESGYRTVPIPDELFRRLSQKSFSKYLFPGERTGKPISGKVYTRAWKAILNLMDLEMGAKTYRNKIIPETSVVDREITPYYLRHTYCSMLAENGVDIKTAQYFMGHSDISVTANIYQHVTEKMLAAGAEQVKNL